MSFITTTTVIHSKKTDRCIWTAYAIAMIVLAALFPLSGDDWSWAVTYEFSTFNGRYLGNLIVRVLTQNLWLRPFVTGITLTWITFCVAGEGKRQTLFAMALILGINIDMLAQGYQWTAGFVNYTLPIGLLFLLARVFKAAADAENHKVSVPLTVLAALLSFCIQLFTENLTAGMTVFTLVVLLWLRRKGLPGRKTMVFIFMASVIGCIAMMSNINYWDGGGGDTHTMPTISKMLGNVLVNYNGVVAPYLLAKSSLLVLALTAVLMLIIGTGQRLPLTAPLQCALSLLAIFFILLEFHPQVEAMEIAHAARAAAVLIYFILAAATVIIYMPDCKTRREIIIAFLAIVLITGPLLFVNPIGPRCLVISYILLAWIVCRLAAYLARERQVRLSGTIIRRISGMFVLGCMCLYLCIYGLTTYQVHERNVSVAAQQDEGADTIKISKLTFEDSYIWGGTPNEAWTITSFKAYYGIDDETEIKIMK